MTKGEIKAIAFPNTAIEIDQGWYKVGKMCDQIKRIEKNGECAKVGWFQIIKDGKVFAEIKESVCDIFYVNIA